MIYEPRQHSRLVSSPLKTPEQTVRNQAISLLRTCEKGSLSEVYKYTTLGKIIISRINMSLHISCLSAKCLNRDDVRLKLNEINIQLVSFTGELLET